MEMKSALHLWDCYSDEEKNDLLWYYTKGKGNRIDYYNDDAASLQYMIDFFKKEKSIAITIDHIGINVSVMSDKQIWRFVGEKPSRVYATIIFLVLFSEGEHIY